MITKKSLKKMSANGLISQALGLQVSYFILKGKLTQIHLTQIERKLLIIAGLNQSIGIILSFALEISLKSLLMLRFNNFPKSHDLQKLYKALSDSDRFEIAKLYKVKTNFSIEECLEKHKDTFVEYRYLEIESHFNDIDANEALNTIIEFYNQIKVEE